MIKILFLAANPSDTTRLRLNEESRAIDQALRQAEFRHFEIETYGAVQVVDLSALLLRYQPDIVHFSGHGSTTGEIILDDGVDGSHPITMRAVSRLFAVLKDNVRCVVLNACYSELQAQAIAQHIDCVVGMSAAIGDKASITFATAFYQALGYGRDVKTAFELGCLQIDLENLAEQDTPRLLAVKGDPAQIVFVNQEGNPSGKVATMGQMSEPKGASRVTIGNVGSIHGSIIAGGDVSNATITLGGQPVAADKAPSFDEFKQLLAEIQQEMVDIATQQAALKAVSPAASFTIQGAEQSVKDACAKIEPTMKPEGAKSIQQRLTDAVQLLNTILDGAKNIAGKANEAAQTVQPLVERLGPLVEKIGVAVLWAAKLWLLP